MAVAPSYSDDNAMPTSGFVDDMFSHNEHVYSPIRQTQTEKYKYIQRNTITHYQAHSRKTGTTNY